MIHGGIRWARDHNENCSKNGCADCATAEGVIALATAAEKKGQTGLSNKQIKDVAPKEPLQTSSEKKGSRKRNDV